MKQMNFKKELEKEREKLNRLVEEVMKKGIPLNHDKEFMEQNRKVDELVVKVQREEEKHRKHQQER